MYQTEQNSNIAGNCSGDNVIVSTVTYNSSHFLRRLVEAVARQSYPVKKIVAVDNASTQEHKEKNRQLALEFPFLEIVESSENLGGAGGFEKGITYILSQRYKCDWIWIMDDDAFPREDCVENLIKHRDLDKIGALCPLIFGVELQKFQMYHHKNKNKYLNLDIRAVDSVENMPEIVQIETNAFVGPLVKMNVVEDVGIPDGSLFIYGDDTEYMYRISRKYKVYLVKSAVINHRDVIQKENTVNPKGFWKEYYKYRNRLLFVDEFKTSNALGIIGKSFIIRDCFKDVFSTLKRKKYQGNRKKRILLLLMAVKDGCRGKKGKTIDPKDYI